MSDEPVPAVPMVPIGTKEAALVQKPHSGGRPPVEIDCEQLEKLSKMGCTFAELAEFFKCSIKTLKRKLNDVDHPEYREAWQRGRAGLKQTLRRLQMQHAAGKGQSAVTMLIHMSKHQLGESEKLALSNPDGSPIADGRRYVVVLPHNDRDPLPPEKSRMPGAETDTEEEGETPL